MLLLSADVFSDGFPLYEEYDGIFDIIDQQCGGAVAGDAAGTWHDFGKGAFQMYFPNRGYQHGNRHHCNRNPDKVPVYHEAGEIQPKEAESAERD